MKKKQIKSKKRVADYGEVYTDIKQVKAMLDLIPEDAEDIDTTYLEPAMGDGNFLEEILRRKLKKAIMVSESIQAFRINVLRSVSSIYGVDIQEDNVLEGRVRLLNTVSDETLRYFGLTIDCRLSAAISKVLERNLVCGNTLEAVAITGAPLVFCEWTVKDSGRIYCREYRFDDMLSHGGVSTKCIAMHRYNWLVPEKQVSAA